MKATDQPLVSILMNCYNGETYLHDSIRSVLSQTYLNWELIFWDNQSTDNSKAIFQSYNDNRMKYYYASEHTDLGGARAKAYHFLTGEYIAVLDTDDIWFPQKLEKQIKLFSKQDIGIVISDTLFFNNSNERALYGEKFPPEGNVFSELLTGYFVSLETVMFRKSVLDRLDYGFDADFSYIADFDLILRAARISKLVICKEVLAKWRVHEKSDSWQSSVSFPEERERWIKKQISHDPNFLNQYISEIEIMHSKNFLLMAIDALSKNKRIKALRLILKTKFNNYYHYSILLLCFIPFSNLFLQYIQNRRIKRLLK